jgi:signal transduction histidine kinase
MTADADFGETVAELRQKLATREAERDAARAREAALREVLATITASPDDPQPVFDLIVRRACELCNAQAGNLFEYDGTLMHVEFMKGFAPEAEARLRAVYPRPPGQDTLAGRVVLSGQRVHLPDAQADHTLIQQGRGLGARAFLGLPLLGKGRVIGVLTLARFNPGEYDQSAIDLVALFAEQAVIAISGAKTLRELRERTTELAERNSEYGQRIEQQAATIEVLNEMSSSPGDAQPVLDAIARRAKAFCEADSVGVVLLDDSMLHLRTHIGFTPAAAQAYAAAFPRPVDYSTVAGRSMIAGDAVYIPDFTSDPEYALKSISASSALRSSAAVPLLRDGKAIGAIGLARSVRGDYSAAQMELLKTFAEQAVIAITGAETWRALQARTAELADRNAAFAERIDHQAATIDVLKEMSASPADAQPVFDLICQQAMTLLGTPGVALYEYDGTLVHYRASARATSYASPAARVGYDSGWPREPDRGSLACRAILDGTIVHIRDMDAEPGISPEVRALGHKTQISIPLLRDGRAIGAISTPSMRVDGISDTQIELLKTFAEQAVIAIQSAETWRALQERTAELAQRNSDFGERIEQQASTIDVLKIMSSTPDDTRPVFDLIIRRAKELCNSSSAGMWEYRDGLVHFAGIHTDVDMNTPSFAAYVAQFPMVPTRELLSSRVILDNQMLHIRDMEQETDLSAVTRALVKDGLYRSYLAVPLSRDGQAIGCIWLSTPQPGGYTDSQIALLQTFAEQAVIAIGSVATFRALRERTAELARRQNELRVTFENMGDGVAMFDESQRLVAWNRRFQDIIEVPDDVIARRQTFAEYIRYLAERGEYGPGADPEEQIRRLTETVGQRRAYERTRPNGRIIEIRINPVASGGFVVIYADITERKRAETAVRAARDAAEAALRDLKIAQANLVQAEKMASLGQLTAGIAHEIKNPLNFVNNFAALSVELLDELKQVTAPALATLDDDARADADDLAGTLTSNLHKIEEHGKRADNIVRGMLEHSRGSTGERRSVDLNELVEEALNLAYHGARARDQSFNITLERDYAAGIAPIEVAPQDLTRVFLNLFGNGFDAARIRQTTAPAGFEPKLRASTRDRGDSVEIRVRDNGTGVPPEIRDKLFQPFFTTKPTGEGTGLGLSISYDIVTQQHGGSIVLNSELNVFTEFTVTIPRGMASEQGGSP